MFLYSKGVFMAQPKAVIMKKIIHSAGIYFLHSRKSFSMLIL